MTSLQCDMQIPDNETNANTWQWGSCKYLTMRLMQIMYKYNKTTSIHTTSSHHLNTMSERWLNEYGCVRRFFVFWFILQTFPFLFMDIMLTCIHHDFKHVEHSCCSSYTTFRNLLVFLETKMTSSHISFVELKDKMTMNSRMLYWFNETKTRVLCEITLLCAHLFVYINSNHVLEIPFIKTLSLLCACKFTTDSVTAYQLTHRHSNNT